MAKFYFTSEHIEGGNSYSRGAIYDISKPELQESLISAGKAVKVDFPKLDTVSATVDSLINRYKATKQHLETSPRYADMESERAYQLEQIEEQLKADIAKAGEDYKLELTVLEKELAQEAVKSTLKTDEQALQFLDNTVAQLSYSDDLLGDLQLLQIKINGMNAEGKATVLSNFGKLAQAVGDNKEAGAVLKGILQTVKKVDNTAQIDLKLRQLQALKTQDVTAPYHRMQLLKENRSKMPNTIEGGVL
ncbi:hypothetical protein CN383_00110 [Priestia megaterium]|uniref:hypothetical protein n=1 Tax=Priestia megaterium TaxID=1404 RepID=UPI000BF6841C|nr:hypothetical protein [Priestia megaterium]PFB07257.1 hypothetical protein CN383_00110 [Priestia megaterium]